MTDLVNEYPWIVSADDHVVEPPHLFWERLSRRDRDAGPRVVQDHCRTGIDSHSGATIHTKGKDGPMTDWWVYDSWAKPVTRVSACAGLPLELHTPEPINYSDMRPGY